MNDKNKVPYHLAKAQLSLEYITDVLSGDGGGLPFLKFKMFVDAIGSRADSGDKSAEKVLDVLYKMERLIQLAQK